MISSRMCLEQDSIAGVHQTCKHLADIMTKQSTGPHYSGSIRTTHWDTLMTLLWHMSGSTSDDASAFVFVSRQAGV